jgi:hypothetical protein
MPWLVKALLLVARTKRGRKLLLSVAKGSLRAVTSARARAVTSSVRGAVRRSR